MHAPSCCYPAGLSEFTGVPLQMITWMQSQKTRPRAGIQMSRTALITMRAFMLVMFGITLSRVPALMAAWAIVSTSPVFAHLKVVQPFVGPLAHVLGVM
jgi:hypothetical protein